MNHYADLTQLYAPAPAEQPGPESAPIELIEWALQRFSKQKIVLTTSFGMEGCALIDMCSRVESDADLTIAYIDTGFFFPETHALRRKIEARYPDLQFEPWVSPINIQQQTEKYGNNLWKDNPNLCCHIRKVVPMAQNIRNYDFWITGLRKSQTEHRASTEVLSWDWRYHVQKFCPFANWTRKEVWAYVQEHDVPFNQLHKQGYPSIGCFHCTKPVEDAAPDSDNRSGRWNGNEKTECGLHYSI